MLFCSVIVSCDFVVSVVRVLVCYGVCVVTCMVVGGCDFDIMDDIARLSILFILHTLSPCRIYELNRTILFFIL